VSTLAVETRLTTQAAAQARANALLARLSQPRTRFVSLTIDPTRYPGLWQPALSLEVSDRINVRGRPLGGTLISKDSWIERVEHRVQTPNDGKNRWLVTYTLSAV